MRTLLFILLAILAKNIFCQDLNSVIITNVYPDFFLNKGQKQDSDIIYAYAYKNMHLFQMIQKSSNISITSNGKIEKDTTYIINYMNFKDSSKGIIFFSDPNNDSFKILKVNAFKSEFTAIDNVLNMQTKSILDTLPHTKVDSSYYDNASLKSEVFDVNEDRSDLKWVVKWIFEYSDKDISSDFIIISDLDDKLKHKLQKFTFIAPQKWIPEQNIWADIGTFSISIKKNEKIDRVNTLKIFTHFEQKLKSLSLNL